MASTIRGKTISGIVYKLLERAGTQIIGIAVSIVLARLLEPEVVGVVSLAEVFILIFNVIASYGLGNSLIQNKDSNEVDFATAFFSSVVLAIFLYLIIWISSPLIEKFYNYETYHFSTVLRFLGIVVFANAIKSILQAVVAKRLCFKYYFISSLFAIIISGASGIAMAYLGYGIWALAVQSVLFEYVYLLVVWIQLKWIPIWAFSKKSLLTIWGFGWKLIIYGLLNVGYMQVRSLVIAKKYSSEQLAYFNRGFRLAKVIPEEFGNAIMAVLFPVFSLESSYTGIKTKLRKSISVAFYIICPLLFGMFAISDSMITVLLTEKWLATARYLKVFCIAYLFYVIQSIESESIKSLGKSGLLLRINLLSKGAGIILIIFTYNYGVFTISLGFLASLLIEFMMYSIASRKYLNYSYVEQIKDVAPVLIMSFIVAIVCLFENNIQIRPIVKLGIQVLSGITIYIILSIVTKNESYTYLMGIIKTSLRTREKI